MSKALFTVKDKRDGVIQEVYAHKQYSYPEKDVRGMWIEIFGSFFLMWNPVDEWHWMNAKNYVPWDKELEKVIKQ